MALPKVAEVFFPTENWRELEAGNLRVLAGSVRFNETTGGLDCAKDDWHLIYDLLTGEYICPTCPTAAFYLLHNQIMGLR